MSNTELPNPGRRRKPANIYYTLPYFEPVMYSYVFIGSSILAWVADYLTIVGKTCMWTGFAITCALVIATHPTITTDRIRPDEKGNPIKVRRPLVGFKRWEFALDIESIENGLYDDPYGNSDERLHDGSPWDALPNTYKQAVFKEQGASLSLEEVSLTPPKRDEILAKVEAYGVCYSDHFAQTNPLPSFLAMRLSDKWLRVGRMRLFRRVYSMVDMIVSKFFPFPDIVDIYTLERCVITNAEYCTIRREAAIHILQHVNAAKYAPMLCADVTVFNLIRQMNIPTDEIIHPRTGRAGSSGAAVCEQNVIPGRGTIVVFREERLCVEIGGVREDAIAAWQKLRGASPVVSMAPMLEIINPLIRGLGVGKGMSIWSWPSGHAADSEDAIAFADLHGINCLEEEFPLEHCNEAFAAMVEGSVRFRAVITMQ
ncbi:Polyketide synthase enoylreductase [Penicillium canescens]|uniref:Polyketide synthase enoylreductase n=1 Tax=Penicillium canescens TaxID=5083 RepID=UPI0026DF5CE6|nr:Polyketide synthase enoylreductase [Penicillium canescens]KAJ6042591.1 Polyketide synthase enoylreductase [Penicillium canescens]